MPHIFLYRRNSLKTNLIIVLADILKMLETNPYNRERNTFSVTYHSTSFSIALTYCLLLGTLSMLRNLQIVNLNASHTVFSAHFRTSSKFLSFVAFFIWRATYRRKTEICLTYTDNIQIFWFTTLTKHFICESLVCDNERIILYIATSRPCFGCFEWHRILQDKACL